MSSQTAPSASVLELKKRGSVSVTLNENSIVEEIKQKHIPDEKDKFDVKPLFHLVEDIVNRAIQNVNSSVMDTRAYMEDISHQEEVIRLREKFSFKMDQISYKIAYNTSSGVDPHATILSIFSILTSHSWDAKLILTLAAFALNYGECWHLALIYSSNQLAKSMLILKQVADIHKQSGLSAPPLEAVNDLVRTMMDVTRCLIEFQDLATQIEKPLELEPYSTGLGQIPLAIYWTIRSVLASASQITSLTSMGFNYVLSSTEKEELITLTNKLKKKKEDIQKQQRLCQPHIEEARMIKRLHIIKSLLEAPQVDNMNILRALIYYKDDQQPLLDGSNKKADLDVLRKKLVLLLISDLDISKEEIDVVCETYKTSRDRQTQFEIVWIPIIEPPYTWELIKDKFEQKRTSMPWYAVHHPSLIAQEVIKLTKEEWHFKKQPVIVVIDAQGQVACPNALPMMWIWRNQAYPFTTDVEEALWKEESWNLEFLMDDIHPPIVQWITTGECICLYGGEDMEWIKMLTTRAPSAAKAAGISLQMIYVGRSEPSEQVKRNIGTISKQGLSHTLTKEKQRLLWSRIVNMCRSRMQLDRTIYEDSTMQEIFALLNLDASGGAWALFSHGSDLMINAKGKALLHSLNKFVEPEWKTSVRQKGFFATLVDSLKMLQGHIDVRKQIESYQNLLRRFQTTQIDCMRVLKALISAKDYWQPLVHGATKTRVNIDILRRKKMLLLISDLNVMPEDLIILENIYEDIHENTNQESSQYEVIWLPIVEAAIMRTESARKQFENLQANMPWYTVHHPSLIDYAAIKFIKEVWHFDKNMIIVVLDQQGQVASPNALHMLSIWGSVAFPFTIEREEELWKEVTWNFEFLVDGTDIKIPKWIDDRGYICLYGGADMEWIRKFTKAACSVAKSAGITLEMFYVGKSNPHERIRRNITAINAEKLSHCFQDTYSMWFFWFKIKSMWQSRNQIGRTPENDPIMQEIMTILSFDGGEDGGWAMLGVETKESTQEIAKAKGSKFLDCLSEYDEWKMEATQKGFVPTLKKKLREPEDPESCTHVMLDISVGTILERVACPQCHRTMHKFITFKCCGMDS